MIGVLAFASFILTVPTANWLIGNVGVQIDSYGPHLIPVGFGLMAPSGVVMVGLSLVLRDIVQNRIGGVWALSAIFIGAGISAMISPGHLVIASVGAFLLSELADMAVYTPLRRRGLILAVAASGAVGAVIDSIAFLWMAFGDLAYLPGQVLGKVWMTAVAVMLLSSLRSWVRQSCFGK